MNTRDREMLIALRNHTIHLEREGECWSDEENERLEKMFRGGDGISDITLTLQRSERAVMLQVYKRGLYHQKTYEKRCKPEEEFCCPCEACPYDIDTCPHNGKCAKIQEEEDVQ